MSSTLLLHHLEENWEHGYNMFGCSYDEYINNVIDYIKNNTDDIDEVIITRMESVNADYGHKKIEEETGKPITIIKNGYYWYADDDFKKNYKDWNKGNKVVDENGEPIVVYRGSENGMLESENNFFSTSERFSEDYGRVKEYYISLEKIFDPLNEEHIQSIIDAEGGIVDFHSGKDYQDAKEIIEELSNDNWEAIEKSLNFIRGSGYDGVIVYEGGVKNYLVFETKSIKNKSSIDFILENRKGIDWCPGNRHYHDEDDFLMIEDWQRDLVGKNVILGGAFEDECINDIEQVLNTIGVNFERVDSLIIGSGVDYKPSLDARFKKEFEDIINYDESDFENALNVFGVNEFEEIHNRIVGFLLSNMADRNTIDVSDVSQGFFESWVESVNELEQKGESISAQSLINKLREENAYKMSGFYYHGTSMPNKKEAINIGSLTSSFSDLEVIYLCDKKADVEFFSDNRKDSENEQQVIFKIEVEYDNLIKIEPDVAGYVSIDGVDYHISDDREEYFEHLKRLGYDGVVVEANYPNGGSDIAIFEDIHIDDNVLLSFKEGDDWTEFRSVSELNKSIKEDKKRKFKVA